MRIRIITKKSDSPTTWLVSWAAEKAKEIDKWRRQRNLSFVTRAYTFRDRRRVIVRSYRNATYIDVRGLGVVSIPPLLWRSFVLPSASDISWSPQFALKGVDVNFVTAMSLTSGSSDPNVTPVRGTALGDRFDYTIGDAVVPDAVTQWRNMDAVRMGKLTHIIPGNQLSRNYLFITPPEILALTGKKYQGVSLIPVYYERTTDMLTFMNGIDNVSDTEFQTFQLFEPNEPIAGATAFVPAVNLEAVAFFALTMPLTISLVAPSTIQDTQRTTFTDVASGTALTVDWALEVDIPAGTVPSDDGAFEIETVTNILVDSSTTLEATVTITGTVVDGQASTVNAVIVPQMNFSSGAGQETFGDAATVDFTGVTPIVFDIRTLIPFANDLLSIGLKLERTDGKYAYAQGTGAQTQDPFTVGSDITQSGGWPNTGYAFPQHKVAIDAFNSFFNPSWPSGFNFRELVIDPQRFMLTKASGYIYEGVRIFNHHWQRASGRLESPSPTTFARPFATYNTKTTLAMTMRLITFTNGVGVSQVESFDSGILIMHSTRDDSAGMAFAAEMTSSGVLDMTNTTKKDETFSLGTGTFFDKVSTLPPDPGFVRGSTHTIFDPEKIFPLSTVFGDEFVANLVQHDPVSGLTLVGSRSVDPGATNIHVFEGTTQIAEWVQFFLAPVIFADNDPYKEAPLSQAGEFIDDAVQFCSVVNGIPAGFPGAEADGTNQQDGRFFFTAVAAGLVVVNQATLAQDALIWTEDIGLGGTSFKFTADTVPGLASIRWSNAVPGQDGLFLVLLSGNYSAATAIWRALVDDPASDPADVQAAFNNVTTEMDVLFNNFASLEFAVSVITVNNTHLFILNND